MTPPLPPIKYVAVLIYIEQVWGLVYPLETSLSFKKHPTTSNFSGNPYPNLTAITQYPSKTIIATRPDTSGVSHYFVFDQTGLFQCIDGLFDICWCWAFGCSKCLFF